ncbi:MAG: hypothetical protein ACI35P_16355 [Bacillus sp. (in: firmicutes)]
MLMASVGKHELIRRYVLISMFIQVLLRILTTLVGVVFLLFKMPWTGGNI